MVEKDDWDEVAAALRRGEAALVVADADAVSDLASRGAKARVGLPRERRASSRTTLRTPLSAMAGWLHLMESGSSMRSA